MGIAAASPSKPPLTKEPASSSPRCRCQSDDLYEMHEVGQGYYVGPCGGLSVAFDCSLRAAGDKHFMPRRVILTHPLTWYYSRCAIKCVQTKSTSFLLSVQCTQIQQDVACVPGIISSKRYTSSFPSSLFFSAVGITATHSVDSTQSNSRWPDGKSFLPFSSPCHLVAPESQSERSIARLDSKRIVMCVTKEKKRLVFYTCHTVHDGHLSS